MNFYTINVHFVREASGHVQFYCKLILIDKKKKQPNYKSHNVPVRFLGNDLLSLGQVSTYTAGVNMYGAPVDLSFKYIGSLADAHLEEPSSGLRPLKRNSQKKYLSRSLRLNNNNITDLHELHRTISHFLAEPSQLAWLDLSFNNITNIEKVLCELRELRVLYLHGNSIFILSEVDKLGVLPHLHTITLHGNVIETNKAYRNLVVSALPGLKMMDFSAVTRQERVMAKIWHHSNNRRRSRKETLH